MRYLVAIDGAGEHGLDFDVLAVEAESPRAAVEKVTEPTHGYGRDEDGVAYVVELECVSCFRVNDTTRKAVTPTTFEDIVASTPEGLREFLIVTPRDSGKRSS